MPSCHWIYHAEQLPAPLVGAFRCVFSMPRDATVRLHASADERYQLWLNGRPFGRGPERGDLKSWTFDSYDLPLSVGEHTLVACLDAGRARALCANCQVARG